MVELHNNTLVFRFPEVHEDAQCRIEFQRTLRIPDDNREHLLPPGLGRFPMEHVEDHAERLPDTWGDHGGVLLPMYQAEALWISLRCHYPFAIKIAAGKINAVTGDGWTNSLVPGVEDYLVIPGQPWLDGFCVGKGVIRQFVAMPLGQGYTAEEQLSGTAEHGGLQLIVYPMKSSFYEKIAALHPLKFALLRSPTVYQFAARLPTEMGLAPGGLMRQEIYHDTYGFDAWDTSVSSRCFAHILNSAQWQDATGQAAPGKPPSAKDYTDAGLPWFDFYDDGLVALDGSKKLSGLDSVAAAGIKKGEQPLKDNEHVEPAHVVRLRRKSAHVSEGGC